MLGDARSGLRDRLYAPRATAPLPIRPLELHRLLGPYCMEQDEAPTEVGFAYCDHIDPYS
jgi:hypothetical protein